MEKIQDLIIVQFDETERIVHLTARQTIDVNCEERLYELCGTVRGALTEFGPEPVYLIVDIGRFAIDPSLSDLYMQKVGEMAATFLYPSGMARYGYQITRVTIMLGSAMRQTPDEAIFANKEEAYRYIRGLIAARAGEKTEEADEPESDPGESGEIAISQITFGLHE